MARVSMKPDLELQIAGALEVEGIELLEIQGRKDEGDFILSIFIDTEEGVNLDTCSRATRIIKELIDSESGIAYDHLEVSSPGIDRILKKDEHFRKFQGERIKIKTLKPWEGKKQFIGILLGANSEYINLEVEGTVLKIPRGKVSVVRLYPEF